MAIRHRYENRLSKKDLDYEILQWDKRGYVVIHKDDLGGATSLTLTTKKVSPKELYGNQFYNTQQANECN
jgi:hypothetical protein